MDEFSERFFFVYQATQSFWAGNFLQLFVAAISNQFIVWHGFKIQLWLFIHIHFHLWCVFFSLSFDFLLRWKSFIVYEVCVCDTHKIENSSKWTWIFNWWTQTYTHKHYKNINESMKIIMCIFLKFLICNFSFHVSPANIFFALHSCVLKLQDSWLFPSIQMMIVIFVFHSFCKIYHHYYHSQCRRSTTSKKINGYYVLIGGNCLWINKIENWKKQQLTKVKSSKIQKNQREKKRFRFNV